MRRTPTLVAALAALSILAGRAQPVMAVPKPFTRHTKGLAEAQATGKPLILQFVQAKHRRGPDLAKTFITGPHAERIAEHCVLTVLAIEDNKSLAKKYGVETDISAAVAANPYGGNTLNKRVLAHRRRPFRDGHGFHEVVEQFMAMDYIRDSVQRYVQEMTTSYLPLLEDISDEDLKKPPLKLIGAVRFVAYRKLRDKLPRLHAIATNPAAGESLRLTAVESIVAVGDPGSYATLASLLSERSKLGKAAADALLAAGEPAIKPCFEALATTGSTAACSRLVEILTKLTKTPSGHSNAQWLLAKPPTRQQWVRQWQADAKKATPASAPAAGTR